MKILATPTSLFQSANQDLVDRLEEVADEVVRNPYGRPLTAAEATELLMGCDGYLAGLDHITADVITDHPRLKVISRYGAGVDRVDLAAAREHGVIVTSTPGANANGVAELAIGLILDLARSITHLDRTTKGGQWVRAHGVELRGRTLGIVGLGAIGRRLVPIAQGFGMQVAAYDPFLDEGFAADHGITPLPLPELLSTAQVISLHLPLTDETRHVIDADAFARMRPGTILVNASRGGLVDERAALAALEDGTLRGLGLDAFEHEPPDLSDPLFARDDVVITPHTGAHTAEATRGMAEGAVENLITALTTGASPFDVAGR